MTEVTVTDLINSLILENKRAYGNNSSNKDHQEKIQLIINKALASPEEKT
mgnify:CR=1 FL=1